MNQLHVFHISKTLCLGGTEKALRVYCQLLDRKYFIPHAVGVIEGGPHAVQMASAGIPVHILDGNLNVLLDLLRTSSPFGVHLHRAGDHDPLWVGVVKLCHKAAAQFIVETNIFGRLDLGPADALIDRSFHISGSSYLRFMKRATRKGYLKTHRHTVLTFPVDTATFEYLRPSESERLAIRRQLGLPGDAFLCIRTGRPDARKWGDLLLDAMPIIIGKIPKVHFLLISAPPSRERYLQKQSYASQIHVLPLISDERELVKYYHIADIMTHSSKIGESFGLSIAEAMACGLPVVVNSTPRADNAQIELVEHGKTGFIANSASDFASAVRYLYEHPAERVRMASAAKLRIKEYCEAKAVVDDLQKHYAELWGDIHLKFATGNSQRLWSPERLLSFQKEYAYRLTLDFAMSHGDGRNLNSYSLGQAISRLAWVFQDNLQRVRRRYFRSSIR